MSSNAEGGGHTGDVVGDAAQPMNFLFALRPAGRKQLGIVAIGGGGTRNDPLSFVAHREQRRGVVKPGVEQALQLAFVGGKRVREAGQWRTKSADVVDCRNSSF